MAKPIFPKNNPFKDALLNLKKDFVANRLESINVEFSENSFVNKRDVREKSISGKPSKKDGRPAFNQPKKTTSRNEVAIEALRNPLDRLVNDPTGKPIIIRKVPENATKHKVLKAAGQEISTVDNELLEIISVSESSLKFNWTQSTNKVNYQFDYSLGKKFQPGTVADEDRDLVIGFDFGTSSSKVTIRDQQSRRSFAIKFGASINLGDYLLPSKIYLHGNGFYLEPIGQVFSNLKIKAISSDPSETDLLAMVAFMGLVIRHSRSYFFRNYGNGYDTQRFIWRLNVGIPARTAQKFESKERFIKIAKAAILCSYGETNSISIEEARVALENIDPSIMRSNFMKLDAEIQRSFSDSADYFNDDAIHLMPEIMAQIHGFVRSNLWNSQLNPHILLIDIGAGTLDISLCDVIRNSNSEYVYTAKACLVEGLGVSNFVKHRVNKLLNASIKLNSKIQNQVLDALSLLDDINYGGIRVPSNFDEMFGNFKFKNNQAKFRVDSDFKNTVSSALWSKTVLRASNGSIPGDVTWKPFPVFLCGGGSRMDFYKDIVNFYTRCGFKAQFDLKKLPQPDDIFGFDASEDYDRLSVAYGLGYSDLGLFLSDFESPEIQVPGDDSPRWSDSFISKDCT
jgi:hypothetical protein